VYAPTEELTRIANDSRDAFTGAVNAWAEAAKRYVAVFDAQHPVPSAAETEAAIETAYDLAGKLLAEHHALVTTVVAASKQATDAAVERFRTFTVFPG
jgi:thiamine monophosphate kinase